MSSICSASGMAWAIARAAAKSDCVVLERAGGVESGQEPQRTLEQRRHLGWGRGADRHGVGVGSGRQAGKES